MLSYIKGELKLKDENYFVIENNGLGYKVYVAAELFSQFEKQAEVELYLFQYIKEDALDLFGFANYPELKLFEQLISVSGIGPKTALNVFAVARVEDIVSAIVNQDASILKKVSGIGSKTAERIVLELKNKVVASAHIQDLKTSEEMGADSEAVEALVSLGFPVGQARDALRQVDKDVKDVGEKVKQALKLLKQ
jgi:holliday junction DNA helicase RuvA